VSEPATASPARSLPTARGSALWLALPVLWQLYLALYPGERLTQLRELLKDFGGPLPPITAWLFASYPYWIGVPVLFALLSFDVHLRKRDSLAYYVAVLAVSLGAAMAMQVWLVEAAFRPLFDVLRKIG